MKESRNEKTLVFSVAVIVFILLVFVDAYVSTRWGLPGIWWIYEHSVEKKYTEGVRDVLMVAALLMYLFASAVAGQVIALVTSWWSLGSLGDAQREKLRDVLRHALSAAPGGTADLASTISTSDKRLRGLHTALAQGGVEATTLLGRILTPLSARDLSTLELLELGLRRVVGRAHVRVQQRIATLEEWGERAAIAGLAGTILGLVAAGDHLSEGRGAVGIALSASLLKALIGYSTRFVAVYFAGRFRLLLNERQDEFADEALRAYVWNCAHPAPTTGTQNVANPQGAAQPVGVAT